MNWVIMMTMGVSIIVFFIIPATLLWRVKNEQFDDNYEFTTPNDEEESLKEAVELERRKKEALAKKAQKEP